MKGHDTLYKAQNIASLVYDLRKTARSEGFSREVIESFCWKEINARIEEAQKALSAVVDIIQHKLNN